MADPNTSCPSNLNHITTPVRGCGRSATAGLNTCDSVINPVNGRTYSTVCGRIIAYQKGFVTAFRTQSNNIESSYLGGVSLTYGSPGSRQHIWTFAASLSYSCTRNERHFCTNVTVNLNLQLPTFIGSDYFVNLERQRKMNKHVLIQDISQTIYYGMAKDVPLVLLAVDSTFLHGSVRVKSAGQ